MLLYFNKACLLIMFTATSDHGLSLYPELTAENSQGANCVLDNCMPGAIKQLIAIGPVATIFSYSIYTLSAEAAEKILRRL